MRASLKGCCVAVVIMLAVPLSLAGHDNSPGNWQIVPEVIWAAATGGGTWATEIQVIDRTVGGGAQVQVYFFYGGGGNFRGPFTLTTFTGSGKSAKFNNILKNVQDWYDSGFSYYGRVGAMWFFTQDSSHKIHVTARTVNGNYSKTFPGLNTYDQNTANVDRTMMITNLAQHPQYRSTVGFHNFDSSYCNVQFALYDSSGNLIGSTFYKYIPSHDFIAFYPFAEAGVPTGVYDNVWLAVAPIGGIGRLICFGATANNYTNDPAAHIAVQAY